MFGVINLILDIIAGIIAWKIVDPESFIGAIGFLIIWAVFIGIAYIISIFIMGLISGDFSKRK